MMLYLVFLILGSTSLTLQETTDGSYTRETDLTTLTTVQLPSTDETFPTLQTTLNFATQKSRLGGSSCKNQFLCPLQRKSFLSKGFPSVPSKSLVPPFTDSEEEEFRTTEGPKTTLSETETESVFPTTLQGTSTRSAAVILKKRDNIVSKAEATNELKSYLPPKLAPSATAQVDLSYLPPKGVLPAAAAASLDIARVNYLPPLEESQAAAQAAAARAKPDAASKDICSDAFHSFLCTPLKSRKRITGALPNSLIPSQFIRTSFNPSASNVLEAVAPTKPEASNTASQYLTPSTTTAAPVSSFAPQSSNEDRSYLPPPPKVIASPSFNSLRIADEVLKTTTRKAFSSTSTPRPFIQTSIIPFISPKVIEQISTTTPRPRTTTPPLIKLSPAPSNEINRLPPPTTKRPFVHKAAALPVFQQRPKPPSVQVVTEASKPPTTTPRYSPAPTDIDRNYLPPSPKIEPAAAAQVNQAVALAEHHDHHDHHHHHGRDLCTDPFHSFLCAPLKQRKRITGALPPGFNPQSTNRKETRIRLEPDRPEPKPANTFQSETRVKPLEETPAANALVPQSVGYQYPKPTQSFPLPSQTSPSFIRPTSTQKPTTGYQYPKPSIPFPLPSQQSIEVVPKEDRLSLAVISPGYQYPKPSIPFPLPSQKNVEVVPKEDRPKPAVVSPGYQYPKPTIPFPLPSQQNVEVVPKEDRPTPAVVSPGYQYPKPSIPFPLPSEPQQRKLPSTSPSSPQTSTQRVISTSPKPLQAQSSDQRVGYQYPKPSPSLPSGYQYPKPANQLILPTERQSSSDVPKPTPASLRDLGSAEFIPVNKIDSKRQVHTGTHGANPKFGERLRARVRQGISRNF